MKHYDPSKEKIISLTGKSAGQSKFSPKNLAGSTTSKRRSILGKQRRDKQVVININEARNDNTSIRRLTRVDIIPKNLAQELYVEQLHAPDIRITFAYGPAGTGKTLLAVLRAIKALREKEVERIVVTRPAVSVDEQHGFLPGTLNQKMEPWTRPIFDIFEEYWQPREITNMLEDRIIEISPLAYMRGRTFKKSYIIADEMQNATPEQMKMLLTRIGHGTKLSVTGDLQQHDRGFSNNGLKDFLDKMGVNTACGIATCKFDQAHVERDPIVAQVLSIYGSTN